MDGGTRSDAEASARRYATRPKGRLPHPSMAVERAYEPSAADSAIGMPPGLVPYVLDNPPQPTWANRLGFVTLCPTEAGEAIETRQSGTRAFETLRQPGKIEATGEPKYEVDMVTDDPDGDRLTPMAFGFPGEETLEKAPLREPDHRKPLESGPG